MSRSSSRGGGALAVAMARGAPSKATVVRAVGAGAVAQLAGVALVGGAVGLLTWSAQRPGLGTVAGLLVAVEAVAFLRAPLRHAERVAAHDLGLDGLAGWRTWLLEAVATWTPSRLAAASAGDLLTRCLEDTDALQDLWVRVLVPWASTVLALLVASVLLGVADPAAGLGVFLATVLVVACTWERAARVARLGVLESTLRGDVAARAVELASRAEALALLGADRAHRDTTEAMAARIDRLAASREATVAKLGVVASVAGAGALVAAVAWGTLPTAHPALLAGVTLATLACTVLLVSLPLPLEALGHVVGAAERLQELAVPSVTGTRRASGGALVLTDVEVAPARDGPVVVTDVCLTVAPRARVAVLGATGTGKSSLLAVAAGLEPPRTGSVSLDRLALEDLEPVSLRRELAWLPTHPTLLEGRVRDVLDVGRGLDDAALHDALVAVGLDAALHERGGLDAVVGTSPDDLSGGERRRLALARLLAGRPSVLVLDEPTAGLDASAAAAVLEAVRATGASVLVATHDEQVAAWTDHAATVAQGRLRPTR